MLFHITCRVGPARYLGKSQKPPSMADRAREYFTALQRAIDEDNEEEIIDISSQLLNFIPKDVETRQCRAIAYVKTGQFQEAFADLEQLKGLDFEKCMCLYGLGRYQEILDVVQKLPAEIRSEEAVRAGLLQARRFAGAQGALRAHGYVESRGRRGCAGGAAREPDRRARPDRRHR